ncbi:hypothetical protein LSAT2_005098 [Lamellibrachia satsuma]|nr:hypothetical protein LSAT2_005098 [Lamellibrachia satsuma]
MRVEQAEHAAKVAEERAGKAETSARTTERGTQVVYVSRERKLPKLRSHPREDQDVDVIDWIEDIRSSINARKMLPGEMFDFIMEHQCAIFTLFEHLTLLCSKFALCILERVPF